MILNISKESVRKISAIKEEPIWMLNFRLDAFKLYTQLPMPKIESLEQLDFSSLNIYYQKYAKVRNWDNLPLFIRQSLATRNLANGDKSFSGETIQVESEAVFSNIDKSYLGLGVLHTDMDTALKEHPNIVKKYFASVINASEHKIVALSYAFWSGGSFVYVPKNVCVKLPIHATYGISTKNFGQFEHSLVIAEEGSSVHCIEGCMAPVGIDQLLHAGVVEIIAKKNCSVNYSTMQNWSKNVFNLVTKRAIVGEGSTVKWVDCNLGSKTTYKQPSIYLNGKDSSAEVLSLSLAGKGQVQNCGSRVIHNNKNTSSIIKSKSISLQGGKNIYNGNVVMSQKAVNSISNMRCDNIIIDNKSSSKSIPKIYSESNTAKITHEATVSKIDEQQVQYLKTRGFNESESISLIINGLSGDILNEYPKYYANRIRGILKLEI